MGVSTSFFTDAKTVEHELGNASVDESIVNVVAVPPRGKDAHVHEFPELIGNSLRLHAHGVGQVSHAGIALEQQGVQQAQTGVRGQHPENPHQFFRVLLA